MNYCIEPANATKGLYETLQMTCNVFDIDLKKGGMTKAVGTILQTFFYCQYPNSKSRSTAGTPSFIQSGMGWLRK